MSNSPLYDELLEMGYNPSTKKPTTDDVIYIKNKTDKVRKLVMQSGNGNFTVPPDLLWQNLTLKVSGTSATSCLAKGLLSIYVKPVALDQVAYETAMASILSAANALSYTDYTTSITGQSVNVVMNHGITGERFTIYGLEATDYDLSTLGQDGGDEAAVIECVGYFWSARQLRNSLVYTAAGKPLIPVFVKWDIPETGDIPQIPFQQNEINAALGIMTGDSPVSMQINYGGLSESSRYETLVFDTTYSCVYKQLNTSTLVWTIPTTEIITAFNSVIQANTKYNDTVVFDTISGNVLTGSADRVDGRNQAFFSARIPKQAYDHLQLLQWTKPDLVVLRLGNTNYTVEGLVSTIVPVTVNDGSGPVEEYYIPVWLDIQEFGAVNANVLTEIGYAGLLNNNDWTVERQDLNNQVTYDNPLQNAGIATALDLSSSTVNIKVTVNGVTTMYSNVEELLESQDLRILDSDIWQQPN